MNLENQISNPERLNPEQGQQFLPEADLSLLKPNIGPEVNPVINTDTERKESQSETQAVSADIASSAIPVQAIPTPSSTNSGGSLGGFAVPSVAADLDVIEQGWVDVTKQVLASTTEDPRIREEKIKDLQADYLLKRYGRNEGASNSSEEIKP